MPSHSLTANLSGSRYRVLGRAMSSAGRSIRSAAFLSLASRSDHSGGCDHYRGFDQRGNGNHRSHAGFQHRHDSRPAAQIVTCYCD